VLPAATTSVTSPAPRGFEESPHQRPPGKKPAPHQFESSVVSSANTTREMSPRRTPSAGCRRRADRTVPSERSTSAPPACLSQVQRQPDEAPPDAAWDRGRNGSSPAMSFPSRYPASRRAAPGKDRHRGRRPEEGKQRHAEADPRGDSARVSAPGSSRRGSRRPPDPAFPAPAFPAARREERDAGRAGRGEGAIPRRFPGTSTPSGGSGSSPGQP